MKIPPDHKLRLVGGEMKCLYCSYTEPLPDQPPAPSEAVELLRNSKTLFLRWLEEMKSDQVPVNRASVTRHIASIDAFLESRNG